MSSSSRWNRIQAYFQRNPYTYIGTTEGTMSSSSIQRWLQSHFRPNSYSALTPTTETRIQQRHVLVIVGFITVVIGSMLQWSLDLTFSHIVTTINTTIMHDPHSCLHLKADVSEISNKEQINGTYNWDEKTQSSILGAYSAAVMVIQPISGMIADKKGGKAFLALGLLLASLITILTPLIAEFFDSDGVLYSRYIVGGGTAPIMPVFFAMMSKWMPRKERTLVAVIIFPAALLGRVLSIYLTEILLSCSRWKTVFYLYGVIGVLWVVILRKLVYNTPNQHPFISPTEKYYLNQKVRALKRITERDLDPMPFVASMTSKAFWGIVAAYIVKEVTFPTLTINVPEFLQNVFWFDLSESKGIYYMLFVSMWLASIVFGLLCYLLVSKNICTLKGARKRLTIVGSIGTAMAMVLVGYSNCKSVLAIIWLFLGIIAYAAFYSGPFIGVLDISENYAGTVIGTVDNISKTIANIMGYFNQHIVKNALQKEWRIYFGIVTGLITILTFFYLRFVEAHQLWWDDVRTLGYPEGWKHGYLPAEAVIDNDGQTIPKPRDDQEVIVNETEESNSILV